MQALTANLGTLDEFFTLYSFPIIQSSGKHVVGRGLCGTNDEYCERLVLCPFG